MNNNIAYLGDTYGMFVDDKTYGNIYMIKRNEAQTQSGSFAVGVKCILLNTYTSLLE